MFHLGYPASMAAAAKAVTHSAATAARVVARAVGAKVVAQAEEAKVAVHAAGAGAHLAVSSGWTVRLPSMSAARSGR
jgi:outer membrane protein W